jgi:hypothetical protein
MFAMFKNPSIRQRPAKPSSLRGPRKPVRQAGADHVNLSALPGIHDVLLDRGK